MTRDELLSMLERMGKQAEQKAAVYRDALAQMVMHPETTELSAYEQHLAWAEECHLDALALSEARAALEGQETLALQLRVQCLRFYDREPMATCRDAVDEDGRQHCIICRAADALQPMPAPPTEEN